MKGLRKYRSWIALGCFVLVLIAGIGFCVWGLGVPVAAAAGLMIIEAALAVVLHRTELWVHGILLIGEVIAGLAVGQLRAVLTGVIVYIAATMAIQLLTGKGKK